jgi:hypothetical protein
MLAVGDTNEVILAGFPWLELADIQACLMDANRAEPSSPRRQIHIQVLTEQTKKLSGHSTLLISPSTLHRQPLHAAKISVVGHEGRAGQGQRGGGASINIDHSR